MSKKIVHENTGQKKKMHKFTENIFLGLLGSEDTDSCCDEHCKLRPNARCSNKNSLCCIGCNYMSAIQNNH